MLCVYMYILLVYVCTRTPKGICIRLKFPRTKDIRYSMLINGLSRKGGGEPPNNLEAGFIDPLK